MTESDKTAPGKDAPWIFRTYAGHSTAATSNRLYRSNLEKGQTGLSIAFDLPTQTGYDPDHPLARGEVGKVGVPVSHLGDMRALFDQIPLERMNTSMTINATAPWLLALYVALAYSAGSKPLLYTTVIAEAFAEGLADAAFITYLSGLCAAAYTATQFALLTSLAAIALRTIGGVSGFAAAAMGWKLFYAVTMFASLPAMLLMVVILRRHPPDARQAEA